MSANNALIRKIPFNILHKIPFSNYLFYGSVFLMLKVSYDYFSKDYYRKTKKRQLIALLQNLKENYSITDQSTSSLEIIYYIYYKCLHEIYENEFRKFKLQRRSYIKVNYIYGYINIHDKDTIVDKNLKIK